MMKNLFTKRERRQFKDLTKEQVVQAAAWYWRSKQFAVDFTSPYSLRGQQYFSKLGLRQSVDMYCSEEDGGVAADMSFSAELTEEGAVLGAVGAVLVLPVAVAVGAVSYMEYENDAQRLMNEFWAYLQGFPRNPAPPPHETVPGWAQSRVGEPASAGIVCAKCGRSTDPDSKFCKHCGNRLGG